MLDGQGVERNHLVHAVQKFGIERFLQLAGHEVFHLLMRGRFADLMKAEMRSFLNHLRADVRGHDDHRVFKINRTPVAVRQLAVIHDLQQNIEDIGMRLFDFIEQQHGVGRAPDFFGQLPAFVVADIAGRRAD